MLLMAKGKMAVKIVFLKFQNDTFKNVQKLSMTFDGENSNTIFKCFIFNKMKLKK